MPNLKEWVLTDVQNNIWLDQFSISSGELKLPATPPWSITKRTLRGGLRDGVDLIEVNNGALSFSIVPTRGMGIWKGQYRDTCSLGWHAPVRGPVNPAYVNLLDRGGLGWLQGFDEWIVRCGLDSNGAPGQDVVLDNNGNPMRTELTLHGKIANLPAHKVLVAVQTEPPYAVSVVGHVEESMLFCPQLSLASKVTTTPGSNRLVITDQVFNQKRQPAELELLYHCNFGPPLLDAGARLVVPTKEVAPRDPRAQEGIDHYTTYLGPTTGYVEQVYWFDPLRKSGTGETLALLRNSAGDRGAVLRFNTSELPCFTLWKNTGAREEGYVTGLEPGTNYPNRKQFERKQGRVIQLPPGGSRRCELSIEIHDTAAGVAAVEQEIAVIQSQASPIVHRTPHARYSELKAT